MKKTINYSTITFLFFLFIMSPVTANEEQLEKESPIPSSVVDISKENTYPNPSQDLPKLHPSHLAKELLDSTDIYIENPELIKMFNESHIKGSKLAIGMNVSIYLGQWPLSYESEASKINWDFEKVNSNVLDNRGGNEGKRLSYSQEQQKRIKGGLTAELPNSEMVRSLMQLKATEKLGLPLSFSTVIGYGTKADRVYNIPPKMVGYLTAYAPAVNEKGKVTYGEVYLRLKGDKKWLEVKNVTQQGIGAWIPIQDMVNFKIETLNSPK